MGWLKKIVSRLKKCILIVRKEVEVKESKKPQDQVKIPETEENHDPFFCPYCKGKISAKVVMVFNKMYKCSKCKKKFFMAKIPGDFYCLWI